MHKRYTWREYGVWGACILSFQLEVAALIFAILTAITLVIAGIEVVKAAPTVSL
jgi:hypothetical protein